MVQAMKKKPVKSGEESEIREKIGEMGEDNGFRVEVGVNFY
jgi:hypothetical protein